MDDLTRGLAALDEACDTYETAEDYYTGTVGERFASIALQRRVIRSGLSVRFNFAKKPVAAAADRLEIAAVTGPDDVTTAELQRLWEDNSLGLEAPLQMRNACKFGDAYLIVWPADDDNDGEDEGTTIASGRVDIFYNSPLTTRVIYDTENPLRKSYAIRRWHCADGERVDLYYPDRIEKYVLADGTQDNWDEWRDAEDDEWPYDNPYGEIPVFHLRTDRPYGVPLHEGFYGPQDAITKLIISHLSTVDYQAGPQRYAMLESGATSADQEADDDDFGFGDEDAPSEGDSQLRSHPGSLWWLQNVKGVGQFDPAVPATFTDPMLTYLRMGADLTNTPLHKVDPTGDHPSGESLRTAEAPFITKVKGLQRSFGTTYRETFDFAIRVARTLRGGAMSRERVGVDLRWEPAASLDPAEMWEMAKLKKEAGLPLRQILLEAGYTADQVKEWYPSGTQGEGSNV